MKDKRRNIIQWINTLYIQQQIHESANYVLVVRKIGTITIAEPDLMVQTGRQAIR